MAEFTPRESAKRHPYADTGPSTTPGSMTGWPKGMNNVQSSETLSAEWLRNAVNVNINDVGKLKRRVGATKAVSAISNSMRSLWSGTLALVADGTVLYRISGTTLTPLVSTLAAGQNVSYLELHGHTYFTDGVTTGIVDDAGVAHPWGVPVPDSPSPGVTSGTLVAGRYSVCTTYVTGTEEGGACRSVVVDVADGQNIVMALPVTFPPEVVAVNLYVSAPNGTVEYLQGTYVFPGQVVTLSTLPLQGRECATKFLTPPPAGSQLMYYRGRIYIAKGNVVYHTEPMRYGAVRLAQNFLMFPSNVKMLAATKQQDGFFISDENEHYFVSGALEDSQMNFCAPYSAVSGTYMRDELTDEPVWFTEKGWVTGKEGGQLEAKMALSVAVPKYDSGATLYREEDGLRQYVSSFATPPDSNQFSASDYIEAEVIRKGELV